MAASSIIFAKEESLIMKKDFSKYFSGNPLTRLPLHKVVLSMCCAGVLLVSLGAGVVATALNSGADSSQEVSSAPASSAVPTSTPEPTVTPAPEQPVRMDTTVVQQDLGVDVFYVNAPLPKEEEPSSQPESTDSSNSAGSSSSEHAKAASSASQAGTDEENNEPVPVTGIAFKVSITNEKGVAEEYDLDQESGTLLVEDMEPGTYTVALLPMEGFVVPDAQTVTIKEKVVYKADTEKIKEQIKTDAEASAEDTKPDMGPAVELTDTVAYADSSIETQPVTADVYQLADNVDSNGFLRYKDGSSSPYKPVTQEKNGITYIEKAVYAGSNATQASKISAYTMGRLQLKYLSAPTTEEGTQPSGPDDGSSVPETNPSAVP